MASFKIIQLLTLGALLTTPALYAKDNNFYYLGIGLQRANFESDDIDSSSNRPNISLGYMFNRRYGIDGTIYNFIDIKEDDIDLGVSGFGVTGVYNISPFNHVDFYAKGGLIHTRILLNKNHKKEVDESNFGLLAGIGAKFGYGDQNIILEYARVSPDDSNISVVSVGYRYEFH